VTELDRAKIDQAMSCTPEKRGWPIDQEACDLASRKVEELSAVPILEAVAEQARIDAIRQEREADMAHRQAVGAFLEDRQ
jgi:hypothetical protein